MKSIKIILPAIAFVLMNLNYSVCQDLTQEETRQLIIRVENTTNPSLYTELLTMKNIKSDKYSTVNRLKCYRRNDKLIILVLEPSIQNGQVLLRDGDDMWMYLPKSDRIMRVGSKDNSLGGEASNNDLLRVDLSKDYIPSFVGYEDIDGDKCYKIDLKGMNKTLAYDDIIYWISAKTELPIKREYYSISGKRLKTMSFSEPQKINNTVLPAKITIVNEKNKEFRTEIQIELFDVQSKIDEKIFNPTYIKSGRLQ
jgi:outer membrane lipoprotein-sorting protein